MKKRGHHKPALFFFLPGKNHFTHPAIKHMPPAAPEPGAPAAYS
jgi:hypothetical protein